MKCPHAEKLEIVLGGFDVTFCPICDKETAPKQVETRRSGLSGILSKYSVKKQAEACRCGPDESCSKCVPF